MIRFFTLLAEDVRVIMASLGIARFADLVGRVDLLRVDRDDQLEGERRWTSRRCWRPAATASAARGRRRSGREAPIDEQLIAALPVRRGSSLPITNVDRTVGGMLSRRDRPARDRRGHEGDASAARRGRASAPGWRPASS